MAPIATQPSSPSEQARRRCQRSVGTPSRISRSACRGSGGTVADQAGHLSHLRRSRSVEHQPDQHNRRLLPLGVRNGSARLRRAIGRRAQRTTGQGDRRFVFFALRLGTSPPLLGREQPLLRREVTQPDPLCRGRCGFRATTRLQLSASLTHPSHRLPAPTPPSGFGTPRLGASPLATWRSGDLLLSPSAPPMRCPGAVTPPRRLARGSVRPRPASSPEERILRQPSGSPAMPRSEDRLAARLPSFRRRCLGGPPSIPTKTWRSRNLVYREGRENGESGGGERERVGCPRSPDARPPILGSMSAPPVASALHRELAARARPGRARPEGLGILGIRRRLEPHRYETVAALSSARRSARRHGKPWWELERQQIAWKIS